MLKSDLRKPALYRLSGQRLEDVTSDYNRRGVEALETEGKGGRRRGYLSLTEEKKFLTQFMDSALTGLITTVTKIKRAYEAQIGRPCRSNHDLSSAQTSRMAQGDASLSSS